MVFSKVARFLAFILALLVCLGGSPRAVAQSSYEITLERHIERLNAAKDTAPLSIDEAFGDQHSLYDGTVTFSNVDISISGNNRLPVELRRTYGVVDRREASGGGNLGATGQFGALGDWNLDLPHLRGTFAASTGWVTNVSTSGGADGATNERCTNATRPPTVGSWYPEMYWDGYVLHIPGEGDQQLLINGFAQTPQPTDGVRYPWVTKSFWMISCNKSAATPNGYPGESFVATSPEGVKYTFNWVVSRATSSLSRRVEPELPSQGALTRTAVYFMATRIEDRFGNWVSFTYNGSKLAKITSSDGRTITITSYAGDNVTIVDSDVGQWRYAYASGRLKTVTRPDGTTWEYASSGILRLSVVDELGSNEPADECHFPDLTGSAFTYTVTTPSRARGEFTFGPARHWRQGAPRNCSLSPGGGPGYFKIPLYHDVFSLTKKVVSGAGLAPMTWTYAYESGLSGPPAGYGFVSNPPTTKTTVIRGPSSTRQDLDFGIVYQENEGQLLVRRDAQRDGTDLQITRYAYVPSDTNWNQPFADAVGLDPRFAYADNLASSWLRPLLKTTITTHGNGVLLDQYVTRTDTFDKFARPLGVTQWREGGSSRTDVTEYHDHLSKWVLGQVKSITNQDTGKVAEKTDYYASTALPQNRYAFGLLQETRVYGTDGTLSSVKDGLLRETKLASWYRGIPLTITYPDLSRVLVEVDVAGNVRSITNEKSDKTVYDYDAMGRMTTITYPSDPNDWAIESTTRQFVSGELGLPADTWRVQRSVGVHRIRTYYDALLRPVLTEDSNGSTGVSTYTRAEFDHRGAKTFQSYASANSAETAGIKTTYDAIGRVARTDTTDGVSLGSVQYLAGNRRLTSDPRGFETTTTYHGFGEPSYELPTRIDAPEGQVTLIGRDVFGKMTGVTQLGGGARAFRVLTYDGNERLCKREDPESGATLFGYNAASEMVWEAKGQTTSSCTTTKPASATQFVYWPRGWTKTVDYADATGDVSYTYELNGNLKTVKNPTATWTYGWNKRGLLESESVAIDGLTFLIDPEYNTRGDLKSIGYPGGRVVALWPDASGRPTQLGSWISAVTYHPNGVPATFDVGTFGHYEATLNSRQWPESIRQWGGAPAAEMHFVYRYDASGNIESIDDRVLPIDLSPDRTLQYDGLDRLTSASGPWGSGGYWYDAINNIRSAGTASGSMLYSYDPGTNRLSRVEGAVNRIYAYNTRGEVTSDGLYSFTRNNAGQITAIPGVGTYAYDGNGKRIKTVVNGRTEYSIYRKSGELIQFYDATAGARTDLLQLQGKTLVELKKVGTVDTPTYLSVDLLGSPIVFSKANGQVLKRESYGPYGEKLKDVDDVVGYTGHAHDFETGLTYAQARFYDSVVGRFLSTDPFPFLATSPVTFNRYAYANNNPYRFTDPTGEIGFLITGPLKGQSLAEAAEISSQANEAISNGGSRILSGVDAVSDVGVPSKGVAKAGIKGAAKAVKKYFSRAQREEAFEKAGRKCEYCGKDTQMDKPFRPDSAEGDHSDPVSRGGETTKEKLVSSCRDCNGTGQKGAKELGTEWNPSQPNERIQKMIENKLKEPSER